MYYSTPGEKLLVAIIKTARKKKFVGFDLKLLCALHLLERYAAIETLVPRMGRETARNKFRNREHAFLAADRVNLYLICENLGSRYEYYNNNFVCNRFIIGGTSYKYYVHFILFISVIRLFYWKELERSLILDWTEEAH